MSPEIWRPVAGYEGIYEVSDLGRVKSLARLSTGRRHVHVRERMLALAVGTGGYLRVKLHRDGKLRNFSVHRLVALAFVGQPPSPLHEVCHNDGDRRNNVVTNLRWGTRAENNADSVKHGTHPWASKTHCPQGHPYSPENTRSTSPGRRECWICVRARWKRRNEELYGTKKRGAA